MNKEFVFLSGLPRSGSTLLSSILNQNPNIHAEGNSAVCQLMWDTQSLFVDRRYEQIEACGKKGVQATVVACIPQIYYREVNKPIVVDKCRSWTLALNMDMITTYITKTPKIIVLVRSIEEIVKSFVHLRKQNNYSGDVEERLLDDWSEPIVRSLNGVLEAKQWADEHDNDSTFLFVQYDDLVNNPTDTLTRVYDFCGWDHYEHDLSNIINDYPEDDSVYGLMGQHEIRPQISKRDISVKLSKQTKSKCKELDKKLSSVL